MVQIAKTIFFNHFLSFSPGQGVSFQIWHAQLRMLQCFHTCGSQVYGAFQSSGFGRYFWSQKLKHLWLVPFTFHQRWSSQRSRGRLGENGRSLFHDSVWLHVRATGMVEDEQGKNGDGHMWPTVPFNLLHGCARTSSQRSTIYSLTKMEATNGILKCMFHLVYQNRTGPWQYGKGVSHRTGGQVSMESCHIGPLDLWMFFGSKFRDWMKSPVSGPWSMCLRSFQWHQIC